MNGKLQWNEEYQVLECPECGEKVDNMKYQFIDMSCQVEGWSIDKNGYKMDVILPDVYSGRLICKKCGMRFEGKGHDPEEPDGIIIAWNTVMGKPEYLED